MKLNETHDAALTSWVASGNDASTEFPIQNLPFGVFRRSGSQEAWRGGVAIGDQVVDLQAALQAGIFTGDAEQAAVAAVAEQQPDDQADTEMRVPAQIGDYTDMYTSIHHATNIGKLFRPDNPLMPNFQWLPVGYHGRASSIDVSGQSFKRPLGQTMAPGADAPSFGPSKRMDYELEIGIWISRGNELGEPIALDDADDHVFGLCLLNDWSARDIQAWEYQPLGPFLAKNFATTISPWMVTLEALEPFRAPWTRPADHPQPLDYLESADNRQRGSFDIRIESWLQSAKMRDANQAAFRLSHSTFQHSYWSVAQMIAHHAVGGCNMRPGDLVGSGTQSGPTDQEAAAMKPKVSGASASASAAAPCYRHDPCLLLADGSGGLKLPTPELQDWCGLPSG